MTTTTVLYAEDDDAYEAAVQIGRASDGIEGSGVANAARGAGMGEGTSSGAFGKPGAVMAAPRWVVPLFAGAALLLVPWVALLVVALPSAHRAAHWDVAWGGFDVVLVLLLLGVALTAWRASPWLEGAASATAALLFVDAWFDVLTSSTGTELVFAVLEAALVELPMAVLCLLLARRSELQLRFRA